MSMNKCPKCGEKVKFDDIFCQTCGTALISPERPKTKQLMSYIQIIGIVEIVLGIFSLFIGAFISILTFILPRIVELESVQSELPEAELLNFVYMFMLFIAACLVIYAIASIWFGIRLLQYKNSGRIGTMIIGALSIINIPLGTAFGLAALYILTKPEAEALFN